MAEPLYKLTERYMNILEVAEMLDAEQLDEALAGIDDDIEVKADGYAAVIEELKMKKEKSKELKERFAAKEKALDTRIKKMKESLQDSMLLTGKKKFKTDLFSFSIAKNQPSLSVVDETKIPKKYLIEQAPQLNKTIIKQELKNGTEIAGVELTQSQSLRIR